MNYFIQWLLRLIRYDMECFEEETQTDRAICETVRERLREEKGKREE